MSEQFCSMTKTFGLLLQDPAAIDRTRRDYWALVSPEEPDDTDVTTDEPDVTTDEPDVTTEHG